MDLAVHAPFLLSGQGFLDGHKRARLPIAAYFFVFSMGEYISHPESFHNPPDAMPDPLPRTARGAILAAEPGEGEPGEGGERLQSA